MTEQGGPADRKAEEVVQQVPGLAQGDAQMGAGVATQQAGPRTDVRTGQFQVGAALAGLGTTATAINVAAVAMPFDLGFGDIGDDVVFGLARGFEVVAAAMGALLGMNVVFDECRTRRRVGPERTGMLAMLLAAPVAA